MRRRHQQQTDRGAILPLVAISMVVLLGMGAMVIDVGHLYAERRQLQNGADAAALAVAQSCAQGNCGPYTSMAQDYANLSARDGVSTVREICFGGPRLAAGLPRCGGSAPGGATRALGWVRVTTRTLTADGSNEVDFLLAPIVTALSGYTVEATSIAAWGIAGRGRVREWIGKYGDPRDPKVDAVDWVELIPFSETRNYVQRVLENLQVYRARFGGGRKLQIEADLRRAKAVYDELEPVMKTFGKVFHLGEGAGQAQTMKLANNLLSAAAVALTSEVMVMGVKAGLDPRTMLDVINAGSGRNSAAVDLVEVTRIDNLDAKNPLALFTAAPLVGKPPVTDTVDPCPRVESPVAVFAPLNVWFAARKGSAE